MDDSQVAPGYDGRQAAKPFHQISWVPAVEDRVDKDPLIALERTLPGETVSFAFGSGHEVLQV